MRRLGVGIGDALDATVQGERSSRLHLRVTGETILAAPLFQAHAPDDAALLAVDPSGQGDAQGHHELIRFTDGRDPERTLDALMTRMPQSSLAFAFARGERGDVIALERLQGLLRTLLVMAIGLVVASLLHQLLVTSRRQRRELATLRSLGFTSTDVAEVGTAAGATIALMAIVIAVPLGIAAGSLAWRQLAHVLIVLPGTTIEVLSLAVGAVVVAAAAAIVAAALAVGGNRGSPARILRSE